MESLDFLYGTALGRALLRPLVSRPVSKLAGAFLDTPLSRPLIPIFVKNCGIDTGDYDLRQIRCFNDFFCRPLKAGRRPIDPEPGSLIAPCDGLLTAVKIEENTVLPVKQSRYSLSRLLGDEALASDFRDGLCLVFRLCVNHYHRYCYVESGRKGENVFLPGVLHTVRPVALEKTPVFTENCREYCCIETEPFGTMVQMEVGAMLVGKIVNETPWPRTVSRGEERAASPMAAPPSSCCSAGTRPRFFRRSGRPPQGERSSPCGWDRRSGFLCNNIQSRPLRRLF